MNRRLLIGLSLTPFVVACAGLGGQTRTENPERAGQESVAEIVDLRTGEPVSAEDALIRIAAHRHVYVGEHHGDPVSHQAQLAVLEGLHRRGDSVTIGVEWLPGLVQLRLDAWLRGELPEEDLLEAVAWHEHWGHDPTHYMPIFSWARAHKVSIKALGPPPALARRVGRVGVSGLTAAERSSLPTLDSGNAAHRSFFDAMMRRVAHAHGGHGHGHGHDHDHGERQGESLMDRYYLAQLVRDEFMASQVASLVEASSDGVVVVLAGRGHVDHGLGIPERVRASVGAPYIVVLSASDAGAQDELMGADGFGAHPVGDLLLLNFEAGEVPPG